MVFYRNSLVAFNQFYYNELENVLLAYSHNSSFSESTSVKLSFTLSFFVDARTAAKLDLSRSLSVFSYLFGVKPFVKFYRKGMSGKLFKIVGGFSPFIFVKLFKKFLAFKLLTNTKLLELYELGDSSFRFVLHEPLTFFPIKNRYFDYHDWKSPFVFSMSAKNKHQEDQFLRCMSNFFLI